MDLVKLEIAAIRQSDSQNNAYVLLLNEVEGNRQLPIVIGWCEARAIAIALEDNEELNRPLTHDLFKQFSDTYNIAVERIIIHTLIEGIFHASFHCKHNISGEEAKIDARTSDAIALAIRYACPIFTFENILSRAGIVINSLREEKKEEKSLTNEKKTVKKKTLSSHSMKKLKEMLKIAIEKEEYEKASKIRDEINRKKKK